MKRFLAACLLFLAVQIPAGATIRICYAGTASAMYYASIPHFDDVLPFRSSFGGQALLAPLCLEGNHGSLSLEVPIQRVFESLPYGSYRSRGFWSIGLGVGATLALGDRLSLQIGGGTMVNYYEVDEAFVSFYARTGLLVKLLEKPYYRIDLNIPVTTEFRQEITASTLGIGVKISMATTRKEERS